MIPNDAYVWMGCIHQQENDSQKNILGSGHHPMLKNLPIQSEPSLQNLDSMFTLFIILYIHPRSLPSLPSEIHLCWVMIVIDPSSRACRTPRTPRPAGPPKRLGPHQVEEFRKLFLGEASALVVRSDAPFATGVWIIFIINICTKPWQYWWFIIDLVTLCLTWKLSPSLFVSLCLSLWPCRKLPGCVARNTYAKQRKDLLIA